MFLCSSLCVYVCVRWWWGGGQVCVCVWQGRGVCVCVCMCVHMCVCALGRGGGGGGGLMKIQHKSGKLACFQWFECGKLRPACKHCSGRSRQNRVQIITTWREKEKHKPTCSCAACPWERRCAASTADRRSSSWCLSSDIAAKRCRKECSSCSYCEHSGMSDSQLND